ncbi:MAG: ABC transporter substrate-binding protein [Rhodospirillales bacterium]|nr:MAG: ABC transporter substrate-binding protein [Rhodospirillales bacterium]
MVHPVAPVATMTPAGSPRYKALFEELSRLGYAEGGGLVVDRWSAEGRAERLPAIAHEAVALRPDAIFTTTAPVGRALMAATGSIPIVAISNDFVGNGFTTSLSRPTANVTGVSIDAGVEIVGKRVELLRQLAPAIVRLAYLGRAASWDGPDARFLRDVCAQLGVAVFPVLGGGTIDEAAYLAAFATAAAERADSLLVAAQAENTVYQRLIVASAARTRLPAIHESRDWVEVGGLMSYGIDPRNTYRQVGAALARILSGASPRDIPFNQPTRFELVINQRTARALGYEIPPLLTERADEVIE